MSPTETTTRPGPLVGTVEVFADIWCPFAYVGILQVLSVRAELGLRFDLLVRAWPLELVNGRPQDPAKVVAEARELRDQVAPERFAGVRTVGFPTTSLPALALGIVANRHGAATGEAVAVALREALFEEGADVGDPQVLADLAAHFGLKVPDPGQIQALVAEEYAAGRARGVRGSPHFFAGSAQAFCPTLELERFEGGLRAALHPERLASWLRRALTGAPEHP
jgi:predicted DsbA family dithiol-disulfide isomerase